MGTLTVFDLVSPAEVDAGLDEVLDRVTRRDTHGDNYVQVSAVGAAYPMLGIFLRGDSAAVHLLDGESCHVLKGDGSVPTDATAEFRDPFEPATVVFTGDVVVRAGTALRCVKVFAAGADWPSDLSWQLL